MKNLLEEELCYYPEYESFCYQNCLRVLLEADGIDNAALYINAALSLIVKPRGDGFKVSYNREARDLLPQFSKHVKRYYYNKDVSAETILEENVRLVEKTLKPIIVGLDTFYLPYASNYKINHAVHTAIMCNYDSERQEVFIVDWYLPWLFKGKVKQKIFLSARNSLNPFDGTVYSGIPINNNWATFDSTLLEEAPEKLLKQMLGLTIKQFYSHSKAELTGTEALQAIMNYCSEFHKLLSESKEEFSRIHKELFGIRKRYQFFQQYIKIARASIAIAQLDSIVSLLDKIDEQWDIVLLIIMKMARRESNKVFLSFTDNYNQLLNMNSELEQLIRTIQEKI